MTMFNTNFNGTLPFSDLTVQIALAASTALSYTVPGDDAVLYRAEFTWPLNANVYVGYNTTATIAPAGAVTTSSNSSIELRPGVRYVRGGDVLSFISDALVSSAGLSLLQLPSQK